MIRMKPTKAPQAPLNKHWHTLPSIGAGAITKSHNVKTYKTHKKTTTKGMLF